MSSTTHTTRSWPYLAGLAAITVGAALVALLTGGGDTGFEVLPPTVQGDPLPAFADGGEDPAVGMPAPPATGAALLAEGERVSLPIGGTPTLVLFLAHWCPHCQDEVPVVADWLAEDGLPEGVALRAVATGNDPARPNYPPDAWLESEQWLVPTVIDDGSIAEAYGLSGYPFWAAVDGDGFVVGRTSGAVPAERLDMIVDRLAEP